MFCLKYYPHNRCYQDADELKIQYKSADRTLENFLKEYQNKTIIIDISTSIIDETDFILLSELSKKYQNIKIIFDCGAELYLDRAVKYNIPYFFTNPVTKIDQLIGLISYHPTDMYICEELAFSLDKVYNILHKEGIKVRVYPNICQSSFSSVIPSIKQFFIRPEDITLYSAFVDVFELISDQPTQQILFKIYKQEKWFGKLNEIIPSFKGDLDNKYLLNSFGAVRVKCQKRCMYKQGSCNICDRYIELADTFKENNIVIRHKGKK